MISITRLKRLTVKYFVKYLKTKQVLVNISNKTEEEYYEEMFTRNNYWNKPTPNKEESLRWEIIENFLTQIHTEKPTLEILDLGCGRGWLTSKLSTFGNVYGIEPVKSVVLHARKLFPEISFSVGKSSDISRIFKNKKFDLVISSEVIEHVPDSFKANFVSDIERSLNSNGYVIITTPRKEEQKKWIIYTNPIQPVEDWMSEKEVETLFTENKFNIIDQKRFSVSPNNSDLLIEIYQLWLFQKK